MKFTNKYGAPQTLVNLANRDNYSRGKSRISITQLINPPQIEILKQEHHDKLVTDVSDRLWAMMGTALHTVAEAGADEKHLAEERVFAKVMGWIISGAIDVQKVGDKVVLGDYKFTSSWAVMNEKPDWEYQLNCYAYLCQVTKGWKVGGLEIYALIRDWQKFKARASNSYPQAPIQTIPVKLWSFEKQKAYVEERVRVHQDALRAHEWGEDLPLCTDEDRWVRSGTFAVKKDKAAKRASRVFDTKKEAKLHVKEKGGIIEERPGRATRCEENYCLVAEYCKQHNP